MRSITSLERETYTTINYSDTRDSDLFWRKISFLGTLHAIILVQDRFSKSSCSVQMGNGDGRIICLCWGTETELSWEMTTAIILTDAQVSSYWRGMSFYFAEHVISHSGLTAKILCLWEWHWKVSLAILCLSGNVDGLVHVSNQDLLLHALSANTSQIISSRFFVL